MVPRDSLEKYRAKRDFAKTPEPKGIKAKGAHHQYLIQKHAATRLHYDFRLELDGVLKSWAVTRGPSLDPNDRRLAVEVEDHPVAYGSFEGIIPKGQYGGGTVMLWDTGSWEPIGDPHEGLKKGKLGFRLHGKRLKGEWALVRMHTQEKRNNWLLIKKEDEFARPGKGDSLLTSELKSVVSKRTMEQIASAADRTWQSNREEKKKPEKSKAPVPKPKPLPPLKGKSRMPGFIAPQLATLVDALPKAAGWVHEIKFDGYRVISRVESGHVQMLTRTGKDWTPKFHPLHALLTELPVQSAMLDGEVVALDEQGVSSFKALQDALGEEGIAAPLQYYVFDLLFLNGKDLRDLPLLERKALLAPLIEKLPKVARQHIFYSEHFDTGEGDFLQHACRLRLEGVISKRADEPYHSGRGKHWLKAKCHQRQEFVIGGFTLPTHQTPGVGALLLGYYNGKELIYAGRVGTGMTFEQSRDIRSKLEKIRQVQSGFKQVPADGRRGAQWVVPQLVCEVEFTEWTRDGRLRHPSFQGLREDKPAKDIKREEAMHLQPAPPREGKKYVAKTKNTKSAAAEVGGIRITHPDRLLYKSENITKLQMAEYYLQVAEHMLPYVKDRPLSIIRCPEDIKGECFFQRHLSKEQSPHFHEVPVTLKGTKRRYLMIRDLKGLISLVQWGVIEMHPWGCRADDPTRADYLIFDLDPDPGVSWARIVDAAGEIRERLREFGLESFVKTTGGKGLHVTVPIKREYPWSVVKPFTKAMALSMVEDSPDRYTANLSKAARKGRIFIDYLRNEGSATAIAPFAARARDGATVATPLAWRELTPALNPKAFTIETVPPRLHRQKRDPWEEFHSLKQPLPKKALRLLKLI